MAVCGSEFWKPCSSAPNGCLVGSAVWAPASWKTLSPGLRTLQRLRSYLQSSALCPINLLWQPLPPAQEVVLPPQHVSGTRDDGEEMPFYIRLVASSRKQVWPFAFLIFQNYLSDHLHFSVLTLVSCIQSEL